MRLSTKLWQHINTVILFAFSVVSLWTVKSPIYFSILLIQSAAHGLQYVDIVSNNTLAPTYEKALSKATHATFLTPTFWIIIPNSLNFISANLAKAEVSIDPRRQSYLDCKLESQWWILTCHRSSHHSSTCSLSCFILPCSSLSQFCQSFQLYYANMQPWPHCMLEAHNLCHSSQLISMFSWRRNSLQG